MRTSLVAAPGLPGFLPATALAAVVCVRLLALARPTGAGSSDTDVDLRAWRMDRVPMAVASSLPTVLARPLSVPAVVVLTAVGPPGPVAGPLRPAAPAGALLLARTATRPLVRPVHRLLPAEHDGPVGPVGPVGPDEPVAPSRARWDRAA